MRAPEQKNGLRLQAIAGTHVVLLGWDIVEETVKSGLLGFAIQREDHTEQETYWLRRINPFRIRTRLCLQVAMPPTSPDADLLRSRFRCEPKRDCRRHRRLLSRRCRWVRDDRGESAPSVRDRFVRFRRRMLVTDRISIGNLRMVCSIDWLDRVSAVLSVEYLQGGETKILGIDVDPDAANNDYGGFVVSRSCPATSTSDKNRSEGEITNEADRDLR